MQSQFLIYNMIINAQHLPRLVVLSW